MTKGRTTFFVVEALQHSISVHGVAHARTIFLMLLGTIFVVAFIVSGRVGLVAKIISYGLCEKCLIVSTNLDITQCLRDALFPCFVETSMLPGGERWPVIHSTAARYWEYLLIIVLDAGGSHGDEVAICTQSNQLLGEALEIVKLVRAAINWYAAHRRQAFGGRQVVAVSGL